MSNDVAPEINQPMVDAPVEQVEQQQAQERMVPQSEVDKIVSARLARERQRMSPEVGMGGMPANPGFNKEELLQAMDERLRNFHEEQQQAYVREQQKQYADNVAKRYLDSHAKGKELYNDYAEKTQDITPAAYPQVTILASQYDNMPEILYELGGNPSKLVNLHVLALTNRAQAEREMAKLAESIKANQEAKAQNQKSPQPLSRLKPSVVAGQDSGKRTIRDLRKESRFKV